MATAVDEACSKSPHGTVSVPVDSRVPDMPYSTPTADFTFLSTQNQACAPIAGQGQESV